MIYKIGFTGTQLGMTSKQKWELGTVLSKIATTFNVFERTEFHHGCCIGSDEQAAMIAKELGLWTVAHPPINTSKMSRFVSNETRKPKAYLGRDMDIALECDELIATPKEEQEIIRSGTWTTIRYARSCDKLVTIIYP